MLLEDRLIVTDELETSFDELTFFSEELDGVTKLLELSGSSEAMTIAPSEPLPLSQPKRTGKNNKENAIKNLFKTNLFYVGKDKLNLVQYKDRNVSCIAKRLTFRENAICTVHERRRKTQ